MLAFVAAALAGSVYINGIKADALPVATLQNVTVRFDERGNVWIDAPNYRVEVVEVGTPTLPEPEPEPGPVVALPDSAPIAARTWYLITEDVASANLQVDVSVNDQFVGRFRSGEPQRLLDLAPFLRRGRNEVRFTPVPGANQSGSFKLYVGPGREQSGAIRMDNPVVRYSRGPSSATDGPQSYTFLIQ